MPSWRRYLTFWRSPITQDVDDELALHVRLRTTELVARGASEDDARRTVLERLGDLDAARLECIDLSEARERNARNADIIEGVRSDLWYGIRSLRRAPGWTIVALLTIALGVGASTAMMSVADALLLRPVHYPHAERVMAVRREMTFGNGLLYGPMSPQLIDAWRRGAHTIEAITAVADRSARWGTTNDDASVHAAWIDDEFFRFAGARALVGRGFDRDEVLPNGRRAVILSETLWRREFDASADVLGRVVSVDGQTRVVVGVMPATVSLPNLNSTAPDVWLPLNGGGGQRINTVVVRARAGASPGVVARELSQIAAHSDADPVFTGGAAAIRVNRPGDTLQFRSTLLMLSGAVVLLLLVACSNVAHLLFARSAARRVELAVRHALGASRSRLVRQLVTESLVLSLLGGALAVVIGWAAVRAIGSTHPPKLIALSRIAPNLTLLAIAAALASGVGIVIGLLVAWRVARHDLGEALRTGSQNSQHGAGRVRGALVIGETALSSTLLVGALLLVHSVVSLERTDLGFDPRDLYGLTFSARGPELQSMAQRQAFIATLRDRARSIPGIAGTTIAIVPPPRVPYFVGVLETPERPAGPASPNVAGPTNAVAPDYFSMLGIRFLAGRTFEPGALERHDVIVSATLARLLWPGTSPAAVVGRRFRFSGGTPGACCPADPWSVVVGVTADAVSGDLLQDRGEPAMFTPLGQDTRLSLVARVHDRRAMASLRALGRAMNPSSAATVSSVEQGFADALAEPKFAMAVLATFATFGVVLAAIGLYGVIAYTVAQRTREIGIRMTLGATRGMIASLVVRDGLRLAFAGILVGFIGAAAGTRLIQSSLYGVSRGDPLAFAAGLAAQAVIALVACLVPMGHATAVDPVVAVRSD